MKRLSSLFLLLLLLHLQWGNISVYGAANSASDFDFNNGTITGYTGATKDVVIPDTIKGQTVTSIGATAFQNNQLTSVTIPTGVTSIADGAFSSNQLNQVEFNGPISSLSQTAFSNQVKQGDTFHGWFEDQSYTNSWTNTIPAPMTIYAKWNLYSTGIVLSPKTGQVTVGGTQNFQLVENLSDGTSPDQTANTTFTVSDPTIATLQGNILTAIAPGTVTVTATYGSSSDTATITVNAAPATTTGIVLSPKTGQLTIGDTQNFDLVENLSDGTTQNQTANTVFTVSDSTVATIQGNTLTAIASGTVTVTATYGSSSDTATITVADRVVPPVPQPTPQPVVPTPEPTPSPLSDQILIQRVIENGEISYRGYVTLENVQAILQQLVNEEERVVRVQFPAEAATVETTLDVQRAAGAFLANQNVDLLIELANGTIRIPHTSLNGWTEELFFRTVPVKSDKRETIEEKAQQNEQVQAFTGNQMTVNLFGQPVTIKTNMQNRPVTITLPIPADVTEEQRQSLFVYIEHSDGTTEVKRGRIVEMAPGVQGFAFDVTHFSTFALLYSTEKEKVTEEKIVAPYIKGYPDGTFKPNAAVTRAQMATMLARFLTNGDIPTAEATFEDTKNNASKDAIEFVKQAALFNGTSETTFDPNGTITRAQMAGVVARWVETTCAEEDTKVYCQETEKGKVFTDVVASHWAASSIEKVSALGIMSGNSATTFNPNGTLTRAQAVKVLNQLFERPTVEGITESTFRDVPTSHWAIRDIEAAATELMIKK